MFKRYKDYYQGYYNNCFKKYLPEMVRDHKDDYCFYFLTFTFEDRFERGCSYRFDEYFKAFYQKINQKILNKPSYNKRYKAKMILVPERSYHCTSNQRVGVDHYHGILMIHKKTREKFERKCIIHKHLVWVDDIENGIHFKRMEFFLNSDVLYQNRVNAGFNVYSQKNYFVSNCDSDIFTICSYITKNLGTFSENQCNASLSEITDFEGKSQIVTPHRKADDRNFDESDVLMFADISTFDSNKYKHKIIRRKRDYAYDDRDEVSLSAFAALMKKKNNDFLQKFYENYK